MPLPLLLPSSSHYYKALSSSPSLFLSFSPTPLDTSINTNEFEQRQGGGEVVLNKMQKSMAVVDRLFHCIGDREGGLCIRSVRRGQMGLHALLLAREFKVRQVCHIALKRDHEFINTVQQTDTFGCSISEAIEGIVIWLVVELLGELNMNVREIHSRKSQVIELRF
uniref:Uncharacterized protein n=1 Tax=Ficus carica TaxID=3494 RepID=A0AA87ZFX4_FICCA|nr:hypothetical protein TIFTF001_047603 [Ficus carica]